MPDPSPVAPVVYLGLDVGAATTRLARMLPEKPMPTIVRNTLSNEATATVACFPADGDGSRSYGENAAPKTITKAAQTVMDMLEWLLEMKTPSDSAGETGYRSLGEKRLHAVQVMGYYLNRILQQSCPKEVKEAKDVEAFVARLRVCATVPPTASAPAQVALRQAFVLAGVPEEQVILLPADESAALYFHHHQFSNLPSAEGESTQVVVVDIGASSSFATLLSVSTTKVEKILTEGRAIGSNAMDAELVDFVLSEIERKHRAECANLRDDLKAYRRLLRECRKAKEILSTTDETRVQVECIKNDLDVNIPISRALLEQQAAAYLRELIQMLTPIYEKAAASPLPIRVEVIGGGWRSPCIMETIKKVFHVERLGTALDANLALAEGSAILAFLKLHTDADAAATSKPPHQIEAVGVADAGLLQVALSEPEREAVRAWVAAEAADAARDEAVRLHLVALNQLDSLVLQTLSTVDSCTMDCEKREAARSYLMECDDYIRGSGSEASVEELQTKLKAVKEHLAAEFPEIAAHYATKQEEENRKAAELERLSKEKTAEENEPKSDPQRLRVAQRRREQGAVLFKQECWAEAQTRFVQALSVLGQLYDTASEENKSKKDEISLSCHLNIASCSVRLGIWRNAINNCTAALEISPDNAKAYFRRGQAYMGMKEYTEAVQDLEKASKLSSQDAMVQIELGKAKQALEVQKQREKKMYSKMFA